MGPGRDNGAEGALTSEERGKEVTLAVAVPDLYRVGKLQVCLLRDGFHVLEQQGMCVKMSSGQIQGKQIGQNSG